MSDRESKQARAILEIVSAMYDVIKSRGNNGIPSGHLYAELMPILSLDQYQRFVSLLVKSGKVRESGHVLYYVPMTAVAALLHDREIAQ